MMKGQLINAFIWRKKWRMMRKKNKLTSPSQTFPIALKLRKKQVFVQEIVSKLQRNKPTQSQIFNQAKLGFRVSKRFFWL